MPGHLVRQRSGWYIYFWQTYGPRTVSIDDVIFQTAILSISRHRTAIKMTFLESWDQISSKHTLFIWNNRFENLTFCDPGLTRPFRVVDFQGVILQNGDDFSILRAKVAMSGQGSAKQSEWRRPTKSMPSRWEGAESQQDPGGQKSVEQPDTLLGTALSSQDGNEWSGRHRAVRTLSNRMSSRQTTGEHWLAMRISNGGSCWMANMNS